MIENHKYLLILLGLGLIALGADHASYIADQFESSTQPIDKPINNTSEQKTIDENRQKIDDWQFDPDQISRFNRQPRNITKNATGVALRYSSGLLYGHSHRLGFLGSSPVATIGIIYMQFQSLASNQAAADFASQADLQDSSDLGLKTGGAQDVNNFRENIRNGFLPLTSDISYEGLLHEYYFETGQKTECSKLFCPSYSKAVTEDPLSNETEHYTTVGLNSKLSAKEFERKKLNLVVVVDISGSMGSPFDRYYYDRYGVRHEVENYTEKAKMEIAKESLQGLTTHLKPEDRMGIVLYNSQSYKAKPMRKVKYTKMGDIREHIKDDVRDGGGTNMEAGMREASSMLSEYKNVNQSEYENRVIFMTDAMPNTGTTSDEGLMNIAEENAEENIHSTFVGIGVDFNSDLVDSITSIKGANYYSVHSADQFKNRMDKYFEYMVTPLVYNMKLTLESTSFEIEKVYGSTAAEQSTGEILKVNTLFPTPKEDGETKGGVVLAKLEKNGGTDETAELSVEYEKRNGEKVEKTDSIDFSQNQPEYFENNGIRKAVLLTRYADLMKNWIEYEREDYDEQTTRTVPPRYQEEGIEVYPPGPGLGEQERTSEDLQVSNKYEERINKFKDYFSQEIQDIGDDELEQEVEMMETILRK